MFFNNPTAFFAQPRVTTGKNIVTNGLILYLDAGIAASNPGSGSTWYDLSGNGYNWSLINGAAFGGSGASAYVEFDQTNDYAQNSDAALAQIGSLTACTYLVTIRPTAVNESDVFSTNGVGNEGSFLLMLYQVSKVRNHLWTNGGIGVPDNINGNIPTNVIQGVGGGWNMATPLVYAYRNAPLGFFNVSVTPTGTQPTSAYTQLNLGSRDGTGAYYGGRIYNVVVYNRLLSDAEVQQDFTALTA